MRSPTDVRALAAGLAILLVSCAPTPAPSTSPSPSGSAAASDSATPTLTATTTPAPSEAGLELPDPGQPFDPEALLEEMRTSTRPDGVPDVLQTEAIATLLADAMWTFDGGAWDATSIGGSCGSNTCTLEVAGSRNDGVGEDLWIFEVDASTGEVNVVSAELRALPEDLVADLDALARAEGDGGALDDLLLTTARWLPPPQEDSFALSYRSGGEEGSCAAELTVDARTGTIVDEDYTNC